MVSFATSFAAPVRVVDRVHSNASHGGANPKPTTSASFPDHPKVVFRIGNNSKGGAAIFVDHPHFARREAEGGIPIGAPKELRRKPSRTDQLRSPTRSEFDIMNDRTDWHEFEFHAAADCKRRLIACRNGIANLKSLRSNDVSLFAISIVQKGDVGGAVWIVFDGGDLSWDVFFVPLEVDDAEHLFVAAPFVAARDMAVVIAAVGAPFGQ
jgi:hypothetical protein